MSEPRPRRARSPTRCSTRATCSTRTGPARRKNQSRWQFGVLGPPRASAASFAERPGHGDPVPARSRVGRRPAVTHAPALPAAPGALGRAARRRRLPVGRRAGRGRTVGADLGRGGRARGRARRRSTSAGRPWSPVDDPVAASRRSPSLDATGSMVGRIVRRRLAAARRAQRGCRAPMTGSLRLTVDVTNTHPDAVHGKDDAIAVLADRRARAARRRRRPSSSRCSTRRRGRSRRGGRCASSAAGRCWPGRPDDRRGARLADHPLRLPGDRRGERRARSSTPPRSTRS